MEIGKKIKELRILSGMALDDLSKRSEVSISLLSMIERNRSAPTVRTLDRIIKAFGTTISKFYWDMENDSVDNTSPERVTIIPKTDRKKLVLGPERAKAHYELLTPDYRRKLQIMYIHYPVGRNEEEFISHEGEECGVILEGRLKAYVGDRTYILEERGIAFVWTAPVILYPKGAAVVDARMVVKKN